MSHAPMLGSHPGSKENVAMRHVLSLFDLTPSEIHRVFAISEDLKAKLEQGVREAILPGRVMALLFEKPSLRTRVSFESAMVHLGGGSMFLGEDVGWGKREAVSDFARVLSEFVDVVVCRAKSHESVRKLAAYCGCPLINGLTDLYHPCQALADLFTMREVHGSLAGRKLAYVGDANNVARSLAIGCAKTEMVFAIASPSGYRFADDFLTELRAESPGSTLMELDDPREAVEDAAAVYTDVWTSMGQEAEQKERSVAFAEYQVNAELMSAAPADACFLHCLPARRGEEVTDEVMDGPQSRVIQQAGNRMHVQKGLLAWLMTSQS